jgi:hypothetical protein
MSFYGSTNAGMTSRSAIEEFHCLTKHLLHSEGHLEEMMANAARSGHDHLVHELAAMLDRVRRERQLVQKMALDLERNGVEFTGGCTRCQADMGSWEPHGRPQGHRGRAGRSLLF